MDKLNSFQHWVPQFYLRNFSSRNQGRDYYIFAYERSKPVEEVKVKDTAGAVGFYNSQRNDTMAETDMIEDVFSKIESQIAPIIRKIIDTDSVTLTEAQRMNLDYFWSLLYTRTYDFREVQKELYKTMGKHILKSMAADKERFRSQLQKAGVKTSNEKELEKLRHMAGNFDEHFTLDLSGGESGLIKTALELAGEFAPCFYMKHLHLAKSSSQIALLTSDNPIILVAQDTVLGKGLLNSTIIVPLTPDRCLVYHVKKHVSNKFSIGDSLIRKINACTMFYANHFAYSKFKSKTTMRAFDQTNPREPVKTNEFFASDTSLLVTSPATAPYLVRDIFPFLDITG
jgi:hypothetical protein